MIEKFCSRLPREISNPMYNEYYNRLKEINFIIENRDAYKHLLQYKKTIELILSLSPRSCANPFAFVYNF